MTFIVKASQIPTDLTYQVGYMPGVTCLSGSHLSTWEGRGGGQVGRLRMA